jgi:hypothetical protein
MGISNILTIIGWVLFITSLIMKTTYMQKKLFFVSDIKTASFRLNLLVLACFLVSIGLQLFKIGI